MSASNKTALNQNVVAEGLQLTKYLDQKKKKKNQDLIDGTIVYLLDWTYLL